MWCSLGISLLELACDVDLPSGGDSWHRLRKGDIPDHLTEGLCTNQSFLPLTYMLCRSVSWFSRCSVQDDAPRPQAASYSRRAISRSLCCSGWLSTLLLQSLQLDLLYMQAFTGKSSRVFCSIAEHYSW